MLLRLGDFEIDESAFELRRDGQPVPVQKRVFETILYLARHSDRVVTREELLAGPWKNTLVSSSAFAKAVKEARRILGKGAIRTVRGVGFRLVRPVTGGSRPLAEPLTTHTQALATQRPSEAPRPFYGRAEELRRLTAGLAAAETGHGSVMLLMGPPGVGKTHLLERFVSELGGNVAVVWGRCWEAQGLPAFWPWPEVLRELCDRRGASLRDVVQRHVVGLAALVPELLPPEDRQPGKLEESALLPFRVLDDVTSVLRKGSADSLLVLVLEDLHLAGEASLKLLEVLARCIGQSKLFVVVTSRALEGRARAVLRDAIEGALPHARAFELDGLSEAEVADWLASFTARAPAPSVVAAVHRRTAGLPLLIENLLRAQPQGWDPSDSGSLQLGSPYLPEHATRSIRELVRNLSAEAHDALGAAAVLGQELSVALLAEILERDAVAVVGELDAAIARGLLRRISPTRLCFSHALVREALYLELGIAERMRLHAAIARRLLVSVSSKPELIVQAAHHALHAVPGSAELDVVGVVRRAGDWVRGQFAYDLAADYYGRALEVMDSGPSNPGRRGELLLELAQVQGLAGRREAALQSCKDALVLARLHDFDALFGQAVLHLSGILREYIAFDPEFQALLVEALGRAQAHGGVYALLLATRTMAERFSAKVEVRAAWLDEALASARAASDAHVQVAVLRLAAASALHSGEVGVRLATQMVDEATVLGRTELALEANEWLGSCLLELGRGEEFAARTMACAAAARQLAMPHFKWHVHSLEATHALLGGKVEESERLARAGMTAGEPVFGRVCNARLGCHLLSVLHEKDGSDRARVLREIVQNGSLILEVVPTYEPWVLAIARVRAELGSEAEARGVFDGFVTPAWEKLPSDATRTLCLALLAETACLLGAVDRAESIERVLAPYAGQHAAGALGAAYLGPVRFHLGQLSLLRGDLDAAARWLDEASRDADAVRSPVWRAWSEFTLARVLARRGRNGDRGRAAHLVRGAHGTAQALDLPRLRRLATEALPSLA